MDTPIITGLLSYGMSGRVFHAPFLDIHPGFQFRAVAERHAKIAAQRYPGIISYNSIGELLADQSIQFVVVNTPSYLHYDHATEALRAGKHVLIEKPMAATAQQVKTLYELSKKVNRHLFVYQNRRWDSDFLSVQEVIKSGRLGELIEVHFRYDRYKMALSHKIEKESADTPASGLVYDLGPHLIDHVITLFGKPLTSHRVSAMHRDKSAVPDYFSYHFTYPGQLAVSVTSGLLIAAPLPAFVVHGTKGSYIKNRCDVQEKQLDQGMSPTDGRYGTEPQDCCGTLTTIDKDDKKMEEKIRAPKGNYGLLYDAVFNAIVHDIPYPVTEEQLIWQIELLETGNNNM